MMLTLSKRPAAVGLKGHLTTWYRQLSDRDIVAVIRRDAALLHMHNKGEEFNKPAEGCFALLQVRPPLQFMMQL